MGFFDFFRSKKSLTPAATGGVNGGVWLPIVANEPYTGAWQHNDELKRADLISYHAVFTCLSLISSDVGKLRFYTKRDIGGVLQRAASRATRIFVKPNGMQTWQQFVEQWINSKTTRGNTYVFKARDIFGDVYQLHVLNPDRVKTLVSDDGEVFYQIARDKLFNFQNDTIVPASEIIHDRYNCFYHPLVGLSPITACAVSAQQGIAIQGNATTFFKNGSRPSGVLSVPQAISVDKARELKAQWQETHGGANQNGIAVLGDGAKYDVISMSSNDAQLLEQLKLTGEVVCSVFHVPPFKVGLGSIPAGQKVSDLNEIYYSDCLQHYIEAIENLLDIGLELEAGVEVEADLTSLIRMDSSSQIDYLSKGTASGIIAPNEARATIGLPPVDGGNSPLMQQQNYSLSALAKRDTRDDPFNPPSSTSAPSTENDSKTVVYLQNQPTAAQVSSPVDGQAAFDTRYRGVFAVEQSYRVGDFVTKKGGLWHCNVACKGDWTHEHWTLVSKNGGES